MTAIQDQVILVTGSTDGIGKQTAHDLAKMGATVVLHGRNRERAEVTLQEIFAATRSDRLEYYLADFSSLADVRRLAEAVRSKHCTLNTLINNAGIGAGHLTDRQRALSQDGYELRFCVNYLAPFLLTHLLLPCLQYRGSVQSGADAIIYVATSHQLEGVTGKYFDQMQEERAIAEGGHSRAIAQAYDTQARQKLWQLSKSLCNM
jgi:NAD(P)-dependent dehydrogenase (short-subunit alcohol dehydrogenase family)